MKSTSESRLFYVKRPKTTPNFLKQTKTIFHITGKFSMMKFLRLKEPPQDLVSLGLSSALLRVSFFFSFHMVGKWPEHPWVPASSSSGASFPHVPESTPLTKGLGWAHWLQRRSHAPVLKVEVESHKAHMNGDQGGKCSLTQYNVCPEDAFYSK